MPFLWRTDVDGADRPNTLTNRAQDRIIEFIKSLQSSPLAAARLVTGQTVGTSATTVYHNLGRIPQGWCLAGLQTMAIIWETAATSRTPSTITLQSSVSTTVDLLVF